MIIDANNVESLIAGAMAPPTDDLPAHGINSSLAVLPTCPSMEGHTDRMFELLGAAGCIVSLIEYPSRDCVGSLSRNYRWGLHW